jgi:anti-sigma factor RsiW
MCPDPSILSAYRDGEVPSPWAERIAAHVSSCAECARRIESHGRLSAVFAVSPQADSVERAKARVAERLEASIAASPRTRRGPWQGAAIASETPGKAGIARPVSVPGTAGTAASGDFSDFASLLDYLNGQEGYIRITVDIPPNRKFAPGGPAEIRKVSVPPAEGGK